MPARHLDLPILKRFAAARLGRDQMIEAGRHLYACASCRSRLGAEVPGGAKILDRLRSRWPGGSAEQYDPIFERIQDQAAQRILSARQEQAVADALADELEATGEERRDALLATGLRFRNAALGDCLLERSRALWSDDPHRAEQLAGMALALARSLDPATHGHGLICDLQARSWAFIGNCRRIRSELREAEEAFLQAEGLLDEGSCEPLELAQVLDLKASLLRAQRRFGEALSAIDQVAALYRQVRDRHLEGRALVSAAIILGYAGEPEKAIAAYFAAVERIDPARDPHLAYSARHNLLLDLVDTGRAEEALSLLPEVQREAKQAGRRHDRLRLTWIEALLDLALGKRKHVEEKLTRVRSEYMREGNGYLSALVSLDLARFYLEQGRTAETRRLAAEMWPIFLAKDIERESLAALLVFQQAAEQEAATALLVNEVAQRIRQAQANPGEPERPF